MRSLLAILCALLLDICSAHNWSLPELAETSTLAIDACSGGQDTLSLRQLRSKRTARSLSWEESYDSPCSDGLRCALPGMDVYQPGMYAGHTPTKCCNGQATVQKGTKIVCPSSNDEIHRNNLCPAGLRCAMPGMDVYQPGMYAGPTPTKCCNGQATVQQGTKIVCPGAETETSHSTQTQQSSQPSGQPQPQHSSQPSGAKHSASEYRFLASTTHYTYMAKTSCGGMSTEQLVEGTGYYQVASAQAMQGGDCCWCGKGKNSVTHQGTVQMGCFTCAKGVFINRGPRYTGLLEKFENSSDEKGDPLEEDLGRAVDTPFRMHRRFLDSIDRNHNGKLSKDDLIKGLHMEPEEADDFMRVFDRNHDGAIDVDEFLDKAGISYIVYGPKFDKLEDHDHVDLKLRFARAMRETIAKFAGMGVEQDDIDLVFSGKDGLLKVFARITPDPGVNARVLQRAMDGREHALQAMLTSAIKNVRGIEAVSMGKISVSQVSGKATFYERASFNRPDLWFGKEIKVVVGDLCPYAGNEPWCPEKPGQRNSQGLVNHFDFSDPPPGIHNHFFAFEPEPCSPQLVQRMQAGMSACKR